MKSLYFATVLLFSLVEEEFSLAKNLPRLFWHIEYDLKKIALVSAVILRKLQLYHLDDTKLVTMGWDLFSS